MNTLTAPSQSNIVAEIRKLFEHYGPTFVDLAIGKRSDLNALLDFYGAPLRFIGSNFHMVMKDDGAITGEEGIGGEIRRLRHAQFAGSTLDKCDIKVLNAQAALVDAVWLRQDSAGAVARFSVMYLVAQTAEGWRITSAVDLSA
jgi:uncharacterized NTF2-like protein DUF6841